MFTTKITEVFVSMDKSSQRAAAEAPAKSISAFVPNRFCSLPANQKNGISAEDCARRIMKAVRKGKKETYVCRKDVLMVYFRRYIPALYYILVGKVKPN